MSPDQSPHSSPVSRFREAHEVEAGISNYRSDSLPRLPSDLDTVPLNEASRYFGLNGWWAEQRLGLDNFLARHSVPSPRIIVPFQRQDFPDAPRDYCDEKLNYRQLYCGTLPEGDRYKACMDFVARLIQIAFMREAWVLYAVGADPKALADKDGFAQEYERVWSSLACNNQASAIFQALMSHLPAHGSSVFVASKVDLSSDPDPESILGAVMVRPRPILKKPLELRRELAEYGVQILRRAHAGEFGVNGYHVLRHRMLFGIHLRNTECTAGLLAVREDIPHQVPGLSKGSGIAADLLKFSFREVFRLDPACERIVGVASKWSISPNGPFDKIKLYTEKVGGRLSSQNSFLGLPVWRLDFNRVDFQ